MLFKWNRFRKKPLSLLKKKNNFFLPKNPYGGNMQKTPGGVVGANSPPASLSPGPTQGLKFAEW